MGAQKIIDKILADANEKAKSILDQSQKETNELLDSAKANAEQKKDEMLLEAKSEAELIQKRIISSAHMEERQLLLKKKQELIDDAFESALLKISTMDNESFEKLMVKLMADMVETGEETVIINETDKTRLSTDFLKKVNDMAKNEKKECAIVMSDEVRDIGSGFVLKRGGVEINATFEAILRQNREALSGEVVKILF